MSMFPLKNLARKGLSEILIEIQTYSLSEENAFEIVCKMAAILSWSQYVWLIV